MTNKEAIEVLTTKLNIAYFTDEDNEALDLAIKALEERPTGEWIRLIDKWGDSYKCPFCNKQIAGTDLNFCVKCGADMRGEKNEQDNESP